MAIQEKHDQLNQEILSAAKVQDFKLVEEKVALQAKLAKVLEKRESEKQIFDEGKRAFLFDEDPLYAKAKEAGDQELLQKFHDRSLTRWEYLKASKTHKLDLWVDYYYQSLERFDQISDFRDGFAPVKIGDKRGFINEQWEQICEAKYDFVSYFENGFAEVRIGDKRGFINTKWEFFDKLPQ